MNVVIYIYNECCKGIWIGGLTLAGNICLAVSLGKFGTANFHTSQFYLGLQAIWIIVFYTILRSGNAHMFFLHCTNHKLMSLVGMVVGSIFILQPTSAESRCSYAIYSSGYQSLVVILTHIALQKPQSFSSLQGAGNKDSSDSLDDMKVYSDHVSSSSQLFASSSIVATALLLPVVVLMQILSDDFKIFIMHPYRLFENIPYSLTTELSSISVLDLTWLSVFYLGYRYLSILILKRTDLLTHAVLLVGQTIMVELLFVLLYILNSLLLSLESKHLSNWVLCSCVLRRICLPYF